MDGSTKNDAGKREISVRIAERNGEELWKWVRKLFPSVRNLQRERIPYESQRSSIPNRAPSFQSTLRRFLLRRLIPEGPLSFPQLTNVDTIPRGERIC